MKVIDRLGANCTTVILEIICVRNPVVPKSLDKTQKSGNKSVSMIAHHELKEAP